jgi:sulfur-oxidizing protein SoxZ
MAQARISMARQVKPDTPFQVRVLIEHPMETGHRADAAGARVPRNALTQFTCSRDGVLLFQAKLHPSMSMNPYLTFWLKLSESANLLFRWDGDARFSHEQAQKIDVIA